MKQNVGGADKIIRLVLGAAIVIWGILTQSWLGLIGLVPLGTALFNFCPAYLPFGISTCKTKATK
jgi:hypothetical protein